MITKLVSCRSVPSNSAAQIRSRYRFLRPQTTDGQNQFAIPWYLQPFQSLIAINLVDIARLDTVGNDAKQIADRSRAEHKNHVRLRCSS